MNNIDIISIHNTLVRKYQNVNKDHFYFYLARAIPLLEKYFQYKNQQNVIVFHSDTENETDKTDVHSEMLTIIQNYIQLIHTYYPKEEYHWEKNHITEMSAVNNNRKSGDENSIKRLKCHFCHQEGQSQQFSLNDNHFVCEKCGYVSSLSTLNNVSYKDINRVNISSKYTYDRRTHFRDCINQFQGKQNSSVDPKVYESLIEQFILHGLIPSNYLDYPIQEVFKDITKEHILLFLKETGNTRHYEDVVLIYHQITQKPSPDISHLENELLKDFDKLTALYDQKYKNTERKNFINTQYVLFQLLRRHRYPCKREDFNILKTVDRKYYHDMVCQELFEILGWNFQALF